MPKLKTLNSNYTCYLCGCQAFYISINSKKMRCVEKITQCSGFIEKAKATRNKNISLEDRNAHMKAMSIRGNASLKELHNNPEWLASKSKRISSAVAARGGHLGDKNPMYGKHHSIETKQQQSAKAAKRDNACYTAATNTKIANGLAIPKAQKSDWELYREQVLNYTYKSWKNHQDTINPTGLVRGSEYELDHKFSITEGFKQSVDPLIIGHFVNLELLPKSKNRSKRIACSISLDDLRQLAGM